MERKWETNGDCPVWGKENQIQTEVIEDHTWIHNSPRAGGKFQTYGEIEEELNGLSIDQKVRLSNHVWLRNLVEDVAIIDSNLISRMKAAGPVTAFEKLIAFLGSSAKSSTSFGDPITLNSKLPITLAASMSTNDSELDFIVREAQNRSYISNVVRSMSVTEFELSMLGYEALEKGQQQLKPLEKRRKVFVAMWFDESIDHTYRKAIEPAIKSAGYDPVRIDETHFNQFIMDQIISEIKDSEFIVVDYSHGHQGARGGVYWEAGYAAGLGLEVINCCDEKTFSNRHFDVQQLNTIMWEEDKLDELVEKLKMRILATVGRGPLLNPAT